MTIHLSHAQERAIDRLAADGEPVRRIAQMLRMTERVVTTAISRRNGSIHQQRVKWFKDTIRFAAAEGVDLTECPSFKSLHANITLFCMAHPEALIDEVNPDVGCALCRQNKVRRHTLPKDFPYRMLVKWHEANGVWIATAPLFESLHAQGASIGEAKKKLRQIGTTFIQNLVREGTPLPPTDLGRYERVGRKVVLEVLEEAAAPPKVRRKKRVTKPKEARELTVEESEALIEKRRKANIAKGINPEYDPPDDTSGSDGDSDSIEPDEKPVQQVRPRPPRPPKRALALVLPIPIPVSDIDDTSGCWDEEMEQSEPEEDLDG